MPVNVWHAKVDLTDVWHNDVYSFEALRDESVRRVRAAVNRLAFVHDADEWDMVLDELADTDDVREFDSVWNGVYDLADIDRVWIATF